MYTDTKNSYDFVKEPVQSPEDPEILHLHRKLRIQKDRLVSWGLEWSDPSQSPDIDESINKAGLSDLVGSIMFTIKDILAEADPLWQASKGPTSEKMAAEKMVDRKAPLIVWDKARFQDLVRDLTMSIDTLYDLSRTRQSARKDAYLKSEGSVLQSKSSALEEKMFESTRMQTPQQIDPKSLIWPRDLKSIQPGTLPPAKSSRQIIFMRRPNSPSGSRQYSQSAPVVPVLMEHTPYDPIYTVTGITPSLTRFERLFAALSQAYISPERLFSGLLHLIGYFEEAEHSRFCLLYALPNHFGPVDIETPRMPSITILSDLLHSTNFEPSLEIKFRLAHNVANAVFDLHSKGVVHGNIRSQSVVFIEHQTQSKFDLREVNMRQSFLTSADLFSDNATDSPQSGTLALHRHSLDPRITRYTHLTSESKSLDLYSLAMLLLEIGLWSPLQEIFPTVSTVPENPAAVLKMLVTRCGSLYTKAIQACWRAPDDELSQKARPDVMHQKVFWKVSKALDTCCALDDTSDESNEEDHESLPVVSPSQKASQSSTPLRRLGSDQKTPSIITPPVASRSAFSEKPPLPSRPSSSFTDKLGWTERPSHRSSPKPTSMSFSCFLSLPINLTQLAPISSSLQKPSTKPKLCTYPSIRIKQEHLDFWHNGLVPHINHVLRHFYKTHPESVEISLESIGASPSTTKPTILVICTSVTKVRSILKKHLVYDKSIFGLKVCLGKVVRSRKHSVKRSMAIGGHKAANTSHQERPTNGASIGAYVNEMNLPPVSLGGIILVDDKPYGMTVHHMLDCPSDDEDVEPEFESQPILRSSGQHLDLPDLTHSQSSLNSGSEEEEYMYSLSDYDSLSETSSAYASEDEFSDNFSDHDNLDQHEEDEEGETEPGNIPGIPAGCGEHYLVTQPAIDDVDEDFYPNEETRDEDHLDSFQLGEIYASSGIRRRNENGTLHEIDWALFSFEDHRRSEGNNITNGHRHCSPDLKPGEYPKDVTRVGDLDGLSVHCLARTSGLQSGRILPGMVIVKIFGRQTPSSSYQVASSGKLGIPGDSGAWVIDNETGKAAGAVLAWSTRKKVAYISPMDVLVRDIRETLGANRVKLPGGGNIESSLSNPNDNNLSIERRDTISLSSSVDSVTNVDNELTEMLRELNIKLPPTPTQIDKLDPSITAEDLASFSSLSSDSARDLEKGKSVDYFPNYPTAAPPSISEQTQPAATDASSSDTQGKKKPPPPPPRRTIAGGQSQITRYPVQPEEFPRGFSKPVGGKWNTGGDAVVESASFNVAAG